MVIFNRRTIITFVLIIILFLLIHILYKISLNNKKKFLITIVDYRWKPIGNLSIRFQTIGESYQEYYTNNHGQISFYLDNNTEYIQISTGDINENISLIDDDITIRINTINQNTGENYDDEIFN
jgi:hypothetical protein